MEITDGKRRGIRRRGRTELVRVALPNGSFFYVLRGTGHCAPQTLFRLAARCAPVISPTLPIPPDAAVRCFTPRVFPMRRALCALCAILPHTRLPPAGLALGILDPDGALCGATDVLLPLGADVRIVTTEPRRFSADVLRARRLFGAGLTVGENAALLTGCGAVVCAQPHAALRDVPVVLSCVPADGVFSLLPVSLPERYARLCPACVPPDLFAAALAERCGVREPELFSCAGVQFAAERLDTRQTAALWRTRIASGSKDGKTVQTAANRKP